LPDEEDLKDGPAALGKKEDCLPIFSVIKAFATSGRMLT
jgi:hypothetical protein